MPLAAIEDRGAKIVAIPDLSETETVVDCRESLGRIVTGAGVRLVLDLSGAVHINSLGITVLVSALRRVNEVGGRLVLESPHDNVRQLLRILGLDRVFRIVGSRDESLDALGLTGVAP